MSWEINLRGNFKKQAMQENMKRMYKKRLDKESNAQSGIHSGKFPPYEKQDLSPMSWIPICES